MLCERIFDLHEFGLSKTACGTMCARPRVFIHGNVAMPFESQVDLCLARLCAGLVFVG